MQELFANVALCQFNREHIALYERYKNHAILNDPQRIILAGLVAMASGEIAPALAQQLYSYLAALPADKYYSEVYGFMSEFLRVDITFEAHALMIGALFIKRHEARFWLSYWGVIDTKLTRLLTSELECVIHLFAFWFALSPGQFLQPDQRYIVQQFFFNLPDNLDTAQKQPEFPMALDNFNSKASNYAWYPVIQEHLLVRKRTLVTKGQEWVKLVQKRLPGQKINEEAQRQERQYATDIEQLLCKGEVQQQHRHRLAVLYSRQGEEAFWALYKERVARVFLSDDGEYIFEVLSFWFDTAFAHFGGEPYIAQNFFTRLPQIFAIARKEQERQFRKSARASEIFYTGAVQRGQSYGWYPLIRPVFDSKV